MHLDAILLARLQFAFTIAWHIIFPSFSIGLASYLAVLEGLWLATKREVFRTLFLFWVKIFALSFGMGVVSGVVMSYEFGTNWAVFSAKASPVIGPLLGYEVLAAFFLEASFLGVMLMGWKKVGPACTSWPPASSPSAPWSQPSGSPRPTAGCSIRSPSPWTPRAASSPPTGGR